MEDLLIICVPALLIGLIPAAIAHGKGHGFLEWWLFGAALFIIALPASLLIRSNEEEIERRNLQTGHHRKCPYCAEIVRAEAIVCKHCGRELSAQPSLKLVNIMENELLSDGPLRLTNWRLVCNSLIIPLSTITQVEVAQAETGHFVLTVFDNQGNKFNLVQWPNREPADNFANAIENARVALFGKNLPA